MLQRCGQFRLGMEAGPDLVIVLEFPSYFFDRNRPLALVIDTAIDLSHAASAKQFEFGVPRNLGRLGMSVIQKVLVSNSSQFWDEYL